MLLDTTYNIETPEGVELHLPVAGLASRSLAWLVDAMIKYTAVIILASMLNFLGNLGGSIYLISLFVLLWFYNVFFEVYSNGATPGKKVFGLRVMNANGTPVSWSGSVVRNLIRFVDMLPGCYLFGCITVLVTKNFQRLGDLAAGTIVVYRPRQQATARLDEVEAQPLRMALTLDEQQAIVSYGERSSSLNRDRAEELARILQPILGDVDRERLLGYAKWLAGGGTSQ